MTSNHILRKALQMLLPTLFLLSATVHAEDVPFREQRREIFRVGNIDQETVVFLGNSITNFGVWPEFFGEGVKVVNRGISGNYSGEVLSHLDFILSGKPKKIFLMIGINDYADESVIVPNIRRIIRATKKFSPATEFYVESLLPCARADRHGMVEPTNEALREMCEEEGVQFLDVYSKVVADTGNPPGIASQYTNDNLHVTAPGYAAWISDFGPYVGADPVLTVAKAKNVSESSFSTVDNMYMSQYSSLPLDADDILHIGDYNVAAGEWAELLGSQHVKNRGSGIGWGYTMTISKVQTALPYILHTAPAKAFFQVGIKDLVGGTAVATALSQYKAMVQRAQALAPETHLYVESVLPDASATYTATIRQFNDQLKAWVEAEQNPLLTFVDVFTPLCDGADALAEKFQGANTSQSHGINGLAYLQWAATLAPFMGDGIQPLPMPTEAEWSLRQVLAEAWRWAFAAEEGYAVGQYPDGLAEEVAARADEAALLLSSATATDAQILAAAASLQAALDGALAEVNQPRLSDGDIEFWYTLSTPKRSNYHLESQGLGAGAYGRAASGEAAQQWKFQERADGTWDIVNRADGGFIAPNATASAHLQVVQAEPSKGWTFQLVAGTPYYIIVNGSIQLHQTNSSLSCKIINWGGGTNTTDDGCLWLIADAPELEVDPVEPAVVGERLDPSQFTFRASSSQFGTDGDDVIKTYLTDGDVSTMWHSNWGAGYDIYGATQAHLPQFLLIDVGAVRNLGGVGYTGFKNASMNGVVTAAKVFVSEEEFSEDALRALIAKDEAALSASLVDAAFTYANDYYDERVVAFPQAVAGRYIVFLVTASLGNPGNQYAAANEFSVFAATPATSLPDHLTADAIPAAPDALYDLSGRRIAHPTRGIYIRSGRKVVVR